MAKIKKTVKQAASTQKNPAQKKTIGLTAANACCLFYC